MHRWKQIFWSEQREKLYQAVGAGYGVTSGLFTWSSVQKDDISNPEETKPTKHLEMERMVGLCLNNDVKHVDVLSVVPYYSCIPGRVMGPCSCNAYVYGFEGEWKGRSNPWSFLSDSGAAHWTWPSYYIFYGNALIGTIFIGNVPLGLPPHSWKRIFALDSKGAKTNQLIWVVVQLVQVQPCSTESSLKCICVLNLCNR